MSWWDMVVFGLRAIVIIWFFSYILRPFLPQQYNDFAEIVGLRLLTLIVGTPLFLRNLWVFSSSIAYFLGMFSILGLLLTGILLLGYTLVVQLGFTYDQIQPFYDLAVTLSENKAAWAGATVIVATTVAIGHMWNLRINMAKFDKEMAKLQREEKEAMEKRIKENRARVFENT